ncbi:MAG: gliding motility-associated C-terminal domain-containing protein [Bacteroidetes bacterium]|nr:MAG: gliding motility-associated C-terminal domain-containing protein [Bacteroidota bacterium]
MKKYILLCLLLSIIHFVCKAQIDTEFWFVAPDVVSIAQGHADRPIFFRVVTTQPATVTVSIPSNPSFAPIIVNLPANTVRGFGLDASIDLVENRPFGQVNNKGFLITSTTPISAYYEVWGVGDPAQNQAFQLNPEIFSLKGSKALGKDFYIPSQTSFANAVSEARESIDIVATEDNTSVTFNLTAQAQGSPEYQANQDYIITLNRGQTFALKSTTGNSSFSFRGSSVSANKPIAVTISDDSIDRGGSWDLIGDQLLAAEQWGKEYIVIRNLTGVGQDRVYIVAAEDNTNVISNGNLSTMNRRQQLDIIDMSTTPTVYITSDKPICVMHLTGHIGFNNGIESNSSILPPISCGGATSLSFTRNTPNDFNMYVLVKDIAKGGFTINGNATLLTASDFTAIGTSGWSFANKGFSIAQIPFAVNANGSHTIANSIGNFHVGISSAFRNAANNIVGSNYAYFSNVEQISTNLGANQSICQGQSITLDAGANMTTYAWTRNGVTFGGNTRTITANTSGTYAVSVTQGTCTASSQMTLTVNPIPTPSITTVFNPTYCTSDAPFALVGTPAGGSFTINGVSTNTFNPNVLGIGNYNIVYSLTQNNCTNTALVNNIQINNCIVKQLFIPDLFSPNQDGKNDKFLVSGEIINDFKIKIFTRFGTLVYEGSFQEASLNGWDGTYNGVQQPAGVYMWQISGENVSYKNKKTGQLSLIR